MPLTEESVNGLGTACGKEERLYAQHHQHLKHATHAAVGHGRCARLHSNTPILPGTRFRPSQGTQQCRTMTYSDGRDG